MAKLKEISGPRGLLSPFGEQIPPGRGIAVRGWWDVKGRRHLLLCDHRPAVPLIMRTSLSREPRALTLRAAFGQDSEAEGLHCDPAKWHSTSKTYKHASLPFK